VLFTAGSIWAGWFHITVGALVTTIVSPLVFRLVSWLSGNKQYGVNSRY